jgi:hypothetical protein
MLIASLQRHFVNQPISLHVPQPAAIPLQALQVASLFGFVQNLHASSNVSSRGLWRALTGGAI